MTSAVGFDGPPRGIRERKKRETRQRISDTATALFLQNGFDAVRVADVAAACDVSEKTIYNYFATKEALVLDREPAMTEMIRDALGPTTSTADPIEAMMELISAEVEILLARWGDPESNFRRVLQFMEMIDRSPSLKAAQRDMMDRLAQVAAQVLAERAKVDAVDPEPQTAAHALIDIWGTSMRALLREAHQLSSPAKVQAAVLSDTRRAAHLLKSGLPSFVLAPGAAEADRIATNFDS